MEIVRHLATYVKDMGECALSTDERQAASRSVIDLVAAAAAGFDAPGPRAVQRTAPAVFAPGNHPIWFSGQRAGITGAVWCNSAATAALDLDDGHRLARGHPGAAVIPAAFATAQETGARTEDLLKAIVVGYQVGVSVGASGRYYANTGMLVVLRCRRCCRPPTGTPEHALALPSR